MVKRRREVVDNDSLYEALTEAARRLKIGTPLVHALIYAGVIPARPISGRTKIAKVVTGQLLASCYDVWPPEMRPHYSDEELRRLRGTTAEQVGEQLGLGHTATYQALHNHHIPARRLPDTDRYIIPEDVVRRMEAYDLAILAAGPLSNEICPQGEQDHDASDPQTDEATRA